MFAPVLASAQIRFSADADGMKSGLDQVGKSIGATIGKIAGIAAAATAMFFAVRRIFRRLARAYDDANDPLNKLAVNLAQVGNAALDGLYPIVAFVKSTLTEMGGDADRAQERFDGFAEGVRNAMKRVSEVVINVLTVVRNAGLAWEIFRDSAVGSAFAVRDAFQFVFGQWLPELIANVAANAPSLFSAYITAAAAGLKAIRELFLFTFTEYIPRVIASPWAADAVRQIERDINTIQANISKAQSGLLNAEAEGDADRAARLRSALDGMRGDLVSARKELESQIGETSLKFDFEISEGLKEQGASAAEALRKEWEKIRPEATLDLSDEAKERFRQADRGLVQMDKLFQDNKRFLDAIRPRNQQQDQRQLGAGFIGIEKAMDRVQEQLLKQDTERQQLGELQRLNVAANRIEGAVRSMKTEVVYG